MLQHAKSATHDLEPSSDSEQGWDTTVRQRGRGLTSASLRNPFGDRDIHRAIDGTLRRSVIPSLYTRATVLNGEPNGSPPVQPPQVTAPTLVSRAEIMSPATLVAFADALLDGDLITAEALFQVPRAAGWGWKELAMGVACPAAADMGQRWADDTASFAAVSLGMSLIHRILNQEFHRTFGHLEPRDDRGTVAVASLSGDQHLLGSTLLERHFQIAQWRVYSLLGSRPQELGNMLAARSIDVLCLSLNGRFDETELKQQIVSWRAWSKNKGLRIMVGGQRIDGDPDLVARLAADASASDFDGAVDLAFSLVERNRE